MNVGTSCRSCWPSASTCSAWLKPRRGLAQAGHHRAALALVGGQAQQDTFSRRASASSTARRPGCWRRRPGCRAGRWQHRLHHGGDRGFVVVDRDHGAGVMHRCSLQHNPPTGAGGGLVAIGEIQLPRRQRRCSWTSSPGRTSCWNFSTSMPANLSGVHQGLAQVQRPIHLHHAGQYRRLGEMASEVGQVRWNHQLQAPLAIGLSCSSIRRLWARRQQQGFDVGLRQFALSVQRQLRRRCQRRGRAMAS